MDPPIQKVDPSKLDELVENGKDWALSSGLIMRQRKSKERSDEGEVAPFSLIPTPFPRHLLKTGSDIQEDMGLLYFRCSMDQSFIEDSLKSVVKTDDFTRRLLEIYRKVLEEGMAQTKGLQIQRSDYMAHAPPQHIDDPGSYSLRQVEVNNIASSFSCLAKRCTQWHRLALQELGYSPSEIEDRIPDNGAEDTVIEGLFQAWKAYGNETAVVLLVAEDLNQNIADQRLLEFGFREKTGFRGNTVRMTLNQCAKQLILDPASKTLTISGSTHICEGREVAVVYFRAGYVPTHYPGEEEWDARLKIERSRAIKCPWIGLQLSGTKKVQQVLAEAGMVEKYLDDRPKASVAKVRSCFAGMWALDAGAASTEEALDLIAKNAHGFVLKPQLEGGGNNIYGVSIPPFLKKLSGEEKEAYIVMERIEPPPGKGYLIRPYGQLEVCDTISELGIYGYLLGDVKTKEVVATGSKGHILRTKAVGVEEGGIMAGASALDSPFLV